MSFDVRCPECSAKLRLDEEPEPGTSIECPRCASLFEPPSGKAATPKRKPKPERKPKGAKGKKKGGPKKLRSKKKKTNPLVLLIAVAFGFLCVGLLGLLLVWFVSRAGQLDKVLAYVPNECNHIRGINTGSLIAYPGYKSEVDKFVTPQFTSAVEKLAEITGLDPETMVEYLVIAHRFNPRKSIQLYIIYTKEPYDTVAAGAAIGDLGKPVLDNTAYKMRPDAPGLLTNAVVAFPSPQIIVMGGDENAVEKSLSASQNLEQSLAGNRSEAINVIVRGSIWLIGKKDLPSGEKSEPDESSGQGGGKELTWIESNMVPVSKDLTSVASKLSGVTVAGCWTTPGSGGVRVGLAVECSDEETAKEIVDLLQEGPLGKGDASVPPNKIKRLPIFARDAKLSTEFLQSLKFQSRGECAYLQAKLTDENAKTGMGIFNGPTLGVPGGQ